MTRPIATSARPMRPDASPGGLVPVEKSAIQVADARDDLCPDACRFISRLQGMPPTSQGIGEARRSRNCRPIGLGLGRPGEVYVLIAGIKADVAVHFQISIPARRIGIDRRWIGEVGLILLEVVAGESARKDIHSLGNALAFEPVGSMLPHRISKDWRRQGDASFIGTVGLFDLRDSFRFAIDAAQELIRPRLASRLKGGQSSQYDGVSPEDDVDIRMCLQDRCSSSRIRLLC